MVQLNADRNLTRNQETEIGHLKALLSCERAKVAVIRDSLGQCREELEEQKRRNESLVELALAARLWLEHGETPAPEHLLRTFDRRIESKGALN